MKTKIKKAAVGVVAAAMVLTVGATSALAAAPEYGRNFVDADHDGICDSVGSSYRYIDADNDGSRQEQACRDRIWQRLCRCRWR